MVEDGNVILEKVDTLHNVADELMKFVSTNNLSGVMSLLSLWPL